VRRRDFLKASTLGATLPLLKGCDSPEEDFLVQPAVRPGVLAGESVWYPSVCTQCPEGCGIQVRIVDGNAKKIEGNPIHSTNQGGVCALGHSALQELYNPDRILDPQKRIGNRGDGEFEALSWERAQSEVAVLMKSVSPENMAFIGSEEPGLVAGLLRRLSDSLGAPSPVFLEPPEYRVERRASALSLGIESIPYFDVARSDYVLSIGSPLLDRWHNPVHYTHAVAEMRRGRPGRRGKLTQVEARMSLTSANADEWLPIVPGTEGIFARAIAGILLSQDLVKDLGRRQYERLFPAPPPSLGAAAEECGLLPERIEKIAHEIAAAEHRVVVAGGSAAGHTNGLFNTVAGLGLNLLLENLGEPGGVFAPATFDLGRHLSPSGSVQTPMADLAARVRGESGEPIELLLVVEADPLHELPAGWGLDSGFSDIANIVVLSSFFDDTTYQADLVLPLNTGLERFNAIEPASPTGIPVLSIAESVVEPLGSGQHPGDVLLAVAQSMGEDISAAFPWSNFEGLVRSLINEDLANLPGSRNTDASSYYRDALARGGIFETGDPSLTPPGPSGEGPSREQARFDGEEALFPFLLIPFASIKAGHGRGANRPWLQELPDPMSTVMWSSWVEISPSDASELGVADGDWLRLQSPNGLLEVQAVIDPAVRPGLVGIPLGNGHQDYGRYARGRGSNPMNLVGNLLVDGTNEPAWASTRVRIERIRPGELARFGKSYEQQGEGENIPVGWAPHETDQGGEQ
jgi:anaerobic selenocysteine-containing dehydrogenase